MLFSKSVLEDIAELAPFEDGWRNYGAVFLTAPFFCGIGAVRGDWRHATGKMLGGMCPGLERLMAVKAPWSPDAP